MPTTTATTLRPGREQLTIDGPFAEIKERLLGFYIVDCNTLEEVLESAKEFTREPGALGIRPVQYFHGQQPCMRECGLQPHASNILRRKVGTSISSAAMSRHPRRTCSVTLKRSDNIIESARIARPTHKV